MAFFSSIHLWLTATALGRLIFTGLVAMVPVIELRGAIPFGVALGLPPVQALAAGIVGNLIPVPFIIIFIRKIFNFLRGKSEKLNGLVTRLEDRAAKKGEVVQRYEWLGLFILVAIPLPGTGAWTGALVAALLDIRLRRAMPAIALGVCAAGLIVFLITYGVTALI